MSPQPRPTIEQIRGQSPFPWSTRIVHNGLGGQVFVIDASGKEVPLFNLIALAETVSERMESQKQAQQEQPTE